MCGRYVSVQERQDLVKLFNATEHAPELRESYNVAPTQTVYAVVDRPERDGDQQERQVRDFHWGLVPSWSKDPKIGARMINARVETLDSKPSFRRAFAKRRVVVPMRGYYEWQQTETPEGKPRKQPYYIHPSQGSNGDGILSVAGLYELWRDKSKADDDPDRWLWSLTIITTDATGQLGEIHDRTPLILPADRIDAWLDPALTDPKDVRRVISDLGTVDLAVRRVSTEVNNTRNNGERLIDPLPDQTDKPLQLELAS